MRINESLKYQATFIKRSNNDLSVYKLRNINSTYQDK